MTIRNLLVLKNYNIKTTAENNMIRLWAKSYYDEMQKLVIASALQFIPNLDDIIVDSKDVNTSQDMFKDHMIECYKHWSSGKANVLYCDLDVLFIKKCDVFSLDIKEFFMPGGWTCGVRYYPCTMSQYLWEIMFEENRLWDTKSCKWDHEQDIYCKVESAVEVPTYKVVPPDFIVSELPINEISDPYNFLQILSHDSIMPHALHLHSTRDPITCARYMSDIRKLTS